MTDPLTRDARRLVAGPTAAGELASVVNAAGLVLDGIVFCPPRPRLVLVHVHGSLGNFYQQTFLRTFASILTSRGVALLSFNLTTHDGIAEGYSRSRDMRYVGGSLSRFDTCLDDLDAVLRLARALCPHVVIQGHSLGCDRVLFYVQRRGCSLPLVLLSPCDSRRLQEQWLQDETVEQQVERLSRTDRAALTLLPSAEYGVSGPDGWTYPIPIASAALLSILHGPPFDILHVDASPGIVSQAPAFVYLGTEDAIRGVALDAMAEHLGRILPSLHIARLPGDHSLEGCEETVATCDRDMGSRGTAARLMT